MDGDIVLLSSDDEDGGPSVQDPVQGKDPKQILCVNNEKTVTPVVIESTSCQMNRPGAQVDRSKVLQTSGASGSKSTSLQQGSRISNLAHGITGQLERTKAAAKVEHRSRPKVRVKTEVPQTQSQESVSNTGEKIQESSGVACDVFVSKMAANAGVSAKMKPLDDCELRDASPSAVILPQVPADYDPEKRRPYQCEYCNGKFLSTILLRHHIVVHEEQLKSSCIPFPQYECVICNRKFLYHQSRATHMLLKHPHQFIPPVPSFDEQLKRKNRSSPEPRKPVEKKVRPVVDEPVVKQKESKKPVTVEVKVPDVSQPRDPPPQTVINHQSKPTKRRSPRMNSDFKMNTKSERRCPSCLKQFSDPFQFKHHDPCLDERTIRVRNGYKCIVCSISNRTFKSLSDLRSHWESEKQTHRLPTFSCVYCETDKYLLYEMEMHVLQKHAEKLVL